MNWMKCNIKSDSVTDVEGMHEEVFNELVKGNEVEAVEGVVVEEEKGFTDVEFEDLLKYL